MNKYKICQRCNSKRIVEIVAKCPDGFDVYFDDKCYESKSIDNICDGEYIEPAICSDCGQCQGEWPVNLENLKQYKIYEHPPEDIYKTVNDWEKAIKEHKCNNKNLCCADSIKWMMFGILCQGCSKYFGIKVSDARNSLDTASDEIKNAVQSAQGRLNLVKSIN